jgi:hypothetical protein
MMDAGNPELLEAFDPADDIDERVERADLVQRHLARGHAVDPALGFAEELEGAYGALPYPGRERRLLDHRDEVADVTVWMGMAVVAAGRSMPVDVLARFGIIVAVAVAVAVAVLVRM